MAGNPLECVWIGNALGREGWYSGTFEAGNPASRSEEDASPPTEEVLTEERAVASHGPPREDLERFHGLFASPADGPQRALFLVQNCGGHLVTGPMWADISPWTPRSAGETEFVHDGDSFNQPFRLETKVGPDGEAVSIEHHPDFVASPLQRIGDLDDSFLPKCGGHR